MSKRRRCGVVAAVTGGAHGERPEITISMWAARAGRVDVRLQGGDEIMATARAAIASGGWRTLLEMALTSADDIADLVVAAPEDCRAVTLDGAPVGTVPATKRAL